VIGDWIALGLPIADCIVALGSVIGDYCGLPIVDWPVTIVAILDNPNRQSQSSIPIDNRQSTIVNQSTIINRQSTMRNLFWCFLAVGFCPSGPSFH
jgi:hypothetical protein